MMRIKVFINREILTKYRLQSRFCPEIVVVDSRLGSCVVVLQWIVCLSIHFGGGVTDII